jgi:hypothetical protein
MLRRHPAVYVRSAFARRAAGTTRDLLSFALLLAVLFIDRVQPF